MPTDQPEHEVKQRCEEWDRHTDPIQERVADGDVSRDVVEEAVSWARL